MKWKLDKNLPICPQLCEQICVLISSGELSAGQRLYSVREVALSAGVNPNTVQKAFLQLEQTGLIYSVRGSGWYISDDTSRAHQIVKSMINAKTNSFFSDMQKLGLSHEQIKEIVKEWQQ